MFGRVKIKLERTEECIKKILETANPGDSFTDSDIRWILLTYKAQGGIDLKRKGFAYFGETIVFDKKGEVIKVKTK